MVEKTPCCINKGEQIMNMQTDYDFEIALASAKYSTDSIRIEALLLRSQGWTNVDIEEELGCHHDSVSRWWSKATRLGFGDICAGKRRGRPPILQSNQIQLFKSLIFLTQSYATPYRGEQFAVKLSKHGIFMSTSTLYQNLHKYNFSYQTTRPVNPNRSEIAVKEWKSNFKSVVNELEKRNENKTIKVFFEDETRFGQKGTRCCQWAPIGQRPTRPCQDEFGCGYIFGIVNPLSGQNHFLVTTDVCKEFMQYLLNNFSKSLGRSIHALLVLDNASWHTSSSLAVPKNITLHFLPPYSPDLNPVENLWGYMKENFLCNRIMKGGKEILKAGVVACGRITNQIVQSVCRRDYCST